MIILNEWLGIIGLTFGILGAILLAFSIKTKTQKTITIVEMGKKTNPTETTINRTLFLSGLASIVIGFILQIILIILS